MRLYYRCGALAQHRGGGLRTRYLSPWPTDIQSFRAFSPGSRIGFTSICRAIYSHHGPAPPHREIIATRILSRKPPPASISTPFSLLLPDLLLSNPTDSSYRARAHSVTAMPSLQSLANQIDRMSHDISRAQDGHNRAMHDVRQLEGRLQHLSNQRPVSSEGLYRLPITSYRSLPVLSSRSNEWLHISRGCEAPARQPEMPQ